MSTIIPSNNATDQSQTKTNLSNLLDQQFGHPSAVSPPDVSTDFALMQGLTSMRPILVFKDLEAKKRFLESVSLLATKSSLNSKNSGNYTIGARIINSFLEDDEAKKERYLIIDRISLSQWDVLDSVTFKRIMSQPDLNSSIISFPPYSSYLGDAIFKRIADSLSSLDMKAADSGMAAVYSFLGLKENATFMDLASLAMSKEKRNEVMRALTLKVPLLEIPGVKGHLAQLIEAFLKRDKVALVTIASGLSVMTDFSYLSNKRMDVSVAADLPVLTSLLKLSPMMVLKGDSNGTANKKPGKGYFGAKH